MLEQQQEKHLQELASASNEYDLFREELKKTLPMAQSPREIIEAEVATALKVGNIKNVNAELIVEAMLANTDIYENAQMVSDSILRENKQ